MAEFYQNPNQINQPVYNTQAGPQMPAQTAAPLGCSSNPQTYQNTAGAVYPQGEAHMQGQMDFKAGTSAASLPFDVIGGDAAMFQVAKAGFGVYGEKVFGGGQQFVKNTASKYFSGHDMGYYYMISNRYVLNKLKVLLCPFLHKGSQAWTRIPDQVANKLTYKPPRLDVNAPDLYLPSMGFLTYSLLCCLSMAVGGRFVPEMLRSRIWRGLISWTVSYIILWLGLSSLSSQQVPIKSPFLDLVAFSGYMFVPISLEVGAGLISSYAYYGTWAWGSLCSAVFLVKTLKRIIFAEARNYGVATPASHNYVLLALGLLQFPLSYFMGVLP